MMWSDEELKFLKRHQHKIEIVLSNSELSQKELTTELSISNRTLAKILKMFDMTRVMPRFKLMSELKTTLAHRPYVRVMELYLGRRLLAGETIHHIDMDKTNNKISNLYLCDRSKHQTSHGTLNKVVKKLLETGIIKFIDGEYVMTE